MLARKSALALTTTYLAGVLLSVAGPLLLPDYYYFDAETIRQRMTTAEMIGFNASFNNIALLYRWLGFGSALPHAWAGPMGFTAVYLATVSGSRLNRVRWRPWLFAFFAAWTVPLAIYDGTYSKEVLALLVVASIAHLSVSWRGIAAAVAVALAYALLFRLYWGIVLALWISMLVVWRIDGGWTARLAALVPATLVLSLASHHFAGLWLSDGRTLVMETREFVADAATMFGNVLVNTSPFADLVNTAVGSFTLLVPVFLFSLGGALHIAFGAFQIANTALFAKALRVTPRIRRPRDSEDWRFMSAATFCICYSVVQGMFEPDFGSFAKHEANLLPLLFYVLAHATWASPSRPLTAHAVVGKAR